MDQLTPEQVAWVRNQVGKWLRVRGQNPDSPNQQGPVNIVHLTLERSGKNQAAQYLYTQLAADAEHSALLSRLLSGKDPLPEAPPLKHSYPDYPEE